MLPCKDCVYKRDIPGDAHFSCCFDWDKSDFEIHRCEKEFALKWFLFPANYDPVWGPDECPAFSETLDKSKVCEHNPLMVLASLLAKRF